MAVSTFCLPAPDFSVLIFILDDVVVAVTVMLLLHVSADHEFTKLRVGMPARRLLLHCHGDIQDGFRNLHQDMEGEDTYVQSPPRWVNHGSQTL